MEEKERTQWFTLNKPLVRKYQINIDDEIDEKYKELEKLKERKRSGLYWHNRSERIGTLMKMSIVYKPYSENKVVGILIMPEDSDEKTTLEKKMLYRYLKSSGYEPVCFRQSTETGKVRDCE